LPFVYWQKLVNCATINQLQTKICAKNPMQKLPKNPTKICYAKIQQKSFMIILTKNLQKTLKDIQKLPNFTKQL